ncbi:hypothetical protein Bca52824_096034 [Brassica carinata]|uniref:Protein kinase domain-containing protein n=1 Tax=Brassica carinata TaxID=52824 RepID=A0A8X7TJ66_BRACI|nr:hypothetical protein Bca52824_096034 [Brassica carinata]
MKKVIHLQFLFLAKIFATQFLPLSSSSFAASNPSIAPVYTSMTTFSPGILMGSGQEHRLDAHKKLLIGVIISSSSLGIIILICFGFWIYCRKKASKPIKISGGFKDSNVIGQGGFGCVYKASLDSNTKAANEVELLSKIQHSNIISLLGSASEISSSFIVYELMEKGSLDDQLHGPSCGSALTWHMRMKIALDTARGLEYLHEHCHPPVIHRDLKSSNILLDSSFNAKISDFGLAVSVGVHGSNNIKLSGTLGYVAPEYLLDGKLTDKSDVYAFGVVLLELLLGRRPVEKLSPSQCQSLVTWAMPQLTDRSKLPNIVDPVIKDTMDLKHLYQVAAMAVLCVQPEPSYRPLITDVLHSLVPLVPVELGGTLRLTR